MIHRMLCKFVQGRALTRALACLLALSLVSTCALIPAERAYAETAELAVGHRISYGGYDTNAFSVNGFEAYCGDPGSSTPTSGSYEMQPLQNAAVAAGLWYGFGGPGFRASLWPASSWVGGAMDDDAYRVATHVALAYLASNSAEFACGQCEEAFQRWCSEQLFAAGGICASIRTTGFALDGASSSPTTLPQGFSAFSMVTGNDTQIMYAMDYRPSGHFALQKASSRPSLSEGNESYSLGQARFDLFSDAACTVRAATLVTGEDGIARSPELEPGTYYLKETAAPIGYALNDALIAVKVVAGDSGTVQVSDEPQSCPVDLVLQKVDAETGEPSPLGGASLAGAEYSVRFYGGQYLDVASAEGSGTLRASWTLRTDEKGRLHLDDASKVSGDGFFTDAQGRIVFPLGTVVIQESAPPTGYLLDETVFVVNVTASGQTPSVSTYAVPTHAEQAIRGDLTFVKAAEPDQRRLANVPFRLTSTTTGESHILLTDENGALRTQADWVAHTQCTCANDAAVREDGTIDEELLDPTAGVWFGTETPRDDLGALPFDTYSLEELRASANAGLALIKIPTIIINRPDTSVDLGTIIDALAPSPAVRTTARDDLDGDKILEPSPEATIIDRVNCTGLTIGADYRVIGRLIQRNEGEPVLGASSEPVSAETTFTADAESVTCELSFPFDATEHADSDIVVFESLQDAMTGETIVVETNLDEYEQTVRVASTPPSSEPAPLPLEDAPPVPSVESAVPDEPLPQEQKLAATGDGSGALLAPVLLLLCLAAGAAALLVRKGRPRKRRLYRERLRNGMP